MFNSLSLKNVHQKNNLLGGSVFFALQTKMTKGRELYTKSQQFAKKAKPYKFSIQVTKTLFLFTALQR